MYEVEIATILKQQFDNKRKIVYILFIVISFNIMQDENTM